MSGLLRLKKLNFRAGPHPGGSGLDIEPSTVVVFVGPNNSGKSLALREIEALCMGQSGQQAVILDLQIDITADETTAITTLQQVRVPTPAGHAPDQNTLWVGFHSQTNQDRSQPVAIDLTYLRDAIQKHDTDRFRHIFLKYLTLRLDGRNRFGLSSPVSAGDLQQPPKNHLAALFRNDEARSKVRQMTFEAFGLYFVIDPTGLGSFRVKLSTKPPSSVQEERGLDDAAIEFHKQAKSIEEFSDGVQSFVGLVSAVMSLPHGVLLIDEPEAFLHPNLARRLGRDLTELAVERRGSLVVATHSSDFLMGCIETSPSTTIVRLTYEMGVATTRSLPASELEQIMRDPLLRSTGALRGLFHRAVIVTEADADRAFYDEINTRLENVARGIANALFVNAQNWQTISRITRPLRRLGIPAAAIMDLDVILESTGWPAIYSMMNIDPATQDTFEQQRVTVSGYLAGLITSPGARKPYKVDGIKALSGQELIETQAYLDAISEYGIFIVPVGELERWLLYVGIQGAKTDWLIDAFSKLGSDPASSTYITPGTGDVWEFLDKLATWVDDPNRKGIA